MAVEPPAASDPLKADLHRYLQHGRDAMVSKLDGLSEYDSRRPMTPTGTNLLGLLKHLTYVEYGYFGDTFGRPCGLPWPWAGGDDQADMYASAEESREQVVAGYRAAWAHADRTIDELDLDTVGRVPHWPEDRAGATLGRLLVHVVAETHRHAGHADILRESLDGVAGLRSPGDNLTELAPDHVAKLEAIARRFAD